MLENEDISRLWENRGTGRFLMLISHGSLASQFSQFQKKGNFLCPHLPKETWRSGSATPLFPVGALVRDGDRKVGSVGGTGAGR
jgi:hypothetical protein